MDLLPPPLPDTHLWVLGDPIGASIALTCGCLLLLGIVFSTVKETPVPLFF